MKKYFNLLFQLLLSFSVYADDKNSLDNIGLVCHNKNKDSSKWFHNFYIWSEKNECKNIRLNGYQLDFKYKARFYFAGTGYIWFDLSFSQGKYDYGLNRETLLMTNEEYKTQYQCNVHNEKKDVLTELEAEIKKAKKRNKI